MGALTWLVALLLAAVTLRRCIYLLASLLAPRVHQPSRRFSVAVLASFKNEAFAAPHLLDSLAALDYPGSRISFTLMSDGSSDRTPELLTSWAAGRPNASVLIGPVSEGKSVALNRALAAAPPSDLVAIYDADTRPAATHLASLAGAFEDPRVAAASGLLLPANAAQSVVARYAALETWVYQTVILAGKDRCGANPPVVGSNCLYRRLDLEAAGGFPPGSFSEDIELSFAFTARGLRTRWIRGAQAHVLVVSTLGRFWRQRTRWTSGLYLSSSRARGLEAWLTATGYADRLILVAGLLLIWFGRLHPVWVAAYFAAILCGTLAALLRAHDPGPRWAYVFVAPPMFVIDVAASVWSTLLHVVGRRVEWRTERA